MPKKRYTVEPIISKLREADVKLAKGGTILEVCRRLGVCEQTYYRWKREYGGLRLDQARRFREVERENGHLTPSPYHTGRRFPGRSSLL